MYTPLIDQKPSDPGSILTCLTEAIRLTEETGQEYTIMVFNQQLYKMLVDILWVYPFRFQKVIARLGGMDLLMSFIGCIGNLMKNSGLEEVLASAFAGMEKLLTGSKYFPQNVRALRMVVEELWRPYLPSLHTADDMEEFLNDVSKKSKLQSCGSKTWLDRYSIS